MNRHPVKIVTAAQMRAADQATFDELCVPSRAVMEIAGRAVAGCALERSGDLVERGAVVVAGSGNNGGDGYIAARVLANLGIDVEVLSAAPLPSLQGDAAGACESFRRSGGKIEEVSEGEWSKRTTRAGLVIDALFGTGLTRPVTGSPAQAIEWMKTSGAPVLAVDIPSGIDSDSGEVRGVAVRAQRTITFQALKRGQLLEPGVEYVGELLVADIGLGSLLEPLRSIRHSLITPAHAATLLTRSPLLVSDAHKGKRGHVLVIGGSEGKLGAPRLSGHAALLSGAGLVTIAAPDATGVPDVPELMLASLSQKEGKLSAAAAKEVVSTISGKDAVVLGPGLGTDAAAVALVESVLERCAANSIPLVIDADALNILSTKKELRAHLGPHVVLTPHPGEMARLVEKSVPEVQAARFEVATPLCENHRCVVVLKGARTIVSAPGGMAMVNPAASAVLGTAGSGDSLAGIVGAFCGQGLPVFDAAALGVFVHGVAGEALEWKDGRVFGVTASDIAAQVPRVLNMLLAQSDILAHPHTIHEALPGRSWMNARELR